MTAESTSENTLYMQASALLRGEHFDSALGLLRSEKDVLDGSARLLNIAALALQSLNKLADAEKCFQRAINIDSRHGSAHNNYANLLVDLGRLPEAERQYRYAIELRPDWSGAFYNLAILLINQRRWIDAESMLRKCALLEPSDGNVAMLRVHCLMQLAIWDGLKGAIDDLRARLHSDPEFSFPPFPALCIADVTPEEFQEATRRHVASEFGSLAGGLSLCDGRTSRFREGARLHIGYVSADFNEHPVSQLMAQVFEFHDRSQFMLTGYTLAPPDGSVLRDRIEQALGPLVSLHGLSEVEAAQRIAEDRVDILVDLMGHTTSSRMGIFAMRPAPVQVTYLGFPGSSGADFFDYIIADTFVIPLGDDRYYREKVLRLPQCYLPRDRSNPRPAAPPRSHLGLPDKSIVFCCFNQAYKITPRMFDLWCTLLHEVPNSVLWLPMKSSAVRDNLMREADERGIDRWRLIEAQHAPTQADHLARLQCADLFLDTTPYNAHSTCSDALWMGLPVITCPGSTFASRVAGSLLTTMGLSELIVENLDGYRQLATALARDPQRLAALRQKVITLRDTSPVFDSKSFTRNLEALYESIYK